MLTDSGLQACCEWLLYDEGFEQLAYDDETGKEVKAPDGKLTIGIGFNLQDVGLTLSECLLILKARIGNIDRELSSKWSPFFTDLDEIRRIALINIAYNCGVEGLLKFHDTLAFLITKDYLNASKEVLDSHAARNLTARYARISETLLTGKLPDVIPPHSISG